MMKFFNFGCLKIQHSVSPDGVVGRLALDGEAHVHQDGDREDTDQAGDHQVTTDGFPPVLRDNIYVL